MVKYRYWRLVLWIVVFVPFIRIDAAPARLALVIGNGAYEAAPLANPVFDANDMAAVLKQLGFTVIVATNADRRQMIEAIQMFGQQLRDGDVGLFYFSGHGIQAKGVNYLLPIKLNIKGEADIEFEAVDANRILAQMEDQNGHGVNLIFLDACRDNPFKGYLKSVRSGLAEMRSPSGSLIAYATAPETPALGTIEARNSIYTKHLLQALRTMPSLSIYELLMKVRQQVMAETQDAQIPWVSESLTEQFYFSPPAPAIPVETAMPIQTAQTAAVTKLLKACDQHVQANRLTTGRGGTALECYEQVLQIDPSNAEALAGLDNIEVRYVDLIRQAQNKRDASKVQQYVAALRMVNPESPRLAEIEAGLQTQPPSEVWNTAVWNQSQWQ